MRGRAVLIIGAALTAACGAGGDSIAQLMRDAGEMLVDAGDVMDDMDDIDDAHAATDSGKPDASSARPGGDDAALPTEDAATEQDASGGGDGDQTTTPGTELNLTCPSTNFGARVTADVALSGFKSAWVCTGTGADEACELARVSWKGGKASIVCGDGGEDAALSHVRIYLD